VGCVHRPLSGKDRAEEIGRARTAFLAILAGALATVGAVFTGLSYRLNRAGQITERFTRAIDQLGSSELDIRLGGIYALERIARDSPDDHPQVMEVLTAYVREHAPWPPAQAQTTIPVEHSDAQRLDVRVAAIDALERIARGLAPAHKALTPKAPVPTSPKNPHDEAGPPLTPLPRVPSTSLHRNDNRKDLMLSRVVRPGAFASGRAPDWSACSSAAASRRDHGLRGSPETTCSVRRRGAHQLTPG
jgi:hypothetical protein